MMRLSVSMVIIAFIVFILTPDGMVVDGTWQPKAGCHLVGYEKEVRIPGCYLAKVKINACRGYCMSYSFLSDEQTLERSKGSQLFTSHGSCCAITSSHDVHITIPCENSQVYKDKFRSAKTCDCSLCDTPS